MRSFTNKLCRGVSKASGFLKFTEGYLQVKHPWNTVETSLGSLNILYKAVHSLWVSSLQEIWPSMYFYGLCYCNRQLFPSLPPSVSLVDRGPSRCPVRLCLRLIVGKFLNCPWESPALWTGFSLGEVRGGSSVLRDAEPHYSSRTVLASADPSGRSGGRIPLPSF